MPLLITHIRNGHQTMAVTTTSHRSREMVVSLGPNFGNRHQNRARYIKSTSESRAVNLPLLCLDEMRCIYFMRVSAQLGFVIGIKP
jgi:hypothetical protein